MSFPYDGVILVTGAGVISRDPGKEETDRRGLHRFRDWFSTSLPDRSSSGRYAVVPGGRAGPGPALLQSIRRAARRLDASIHRTLVLASDRAGVDAGRAAGATVVHWGDFEVRASWTADFHVTDLGALGSEKLKELWSERPLPAEVSSSALRGLAEVLLETELGDRVDRELWKGDLWERFGALQESCDSGRHESLWQLWVCGTVVPLRQAAEALGENLFTELRDAELLEEASGGIVARLILLSVDGVLQLKERPRHDPRRQPQWTDTKTCLNQDSRKLASLLAERVEEPVQNGLEVGTGSGYVLLRLCAEGAAADGLGTDVDGRAVHLARANAALNGLDHRVRVVQSDVFDQVESGDPFDLVVFHPPYRLLPDGGIPYPDPLFRHGTGRDGLGLVRSFLRGLDRVLAPTGEAFVYLDLPLVGGSPDPKRAELQKAAPSLQVDFEPLESEGSRRSAQELAEATARKCGARLSATDPVAHGAGSSGAGASEPLTDEERRDVENRVRAAYESQQITAVQRGFLRIGHRRSRRRGS